MANKNQKNKPCTYSELIHGNRVVAGFHYGEIDRILFNVRGSMSNETREKLNYHRAQLNERNEEYSRFVIARACCGDATVLIR